MRPVRRLHNRYLHSGKIVSVEDASSRAFGTTSFSVSALLAGDGAIEFGTSRPPYRNIVGTMEATVSPSLAGFTAVAKTVEDCRKMALQF